MSTAGPICLWPRRISGATCSKQGGMLWLSTTDCQAEQPARQADPAPTNIVKTPGKTHPCERAAFRAHITQECVRERLAARRLTWGEELIQSALLQGCYRRPKRWRSRASPSGVPPATTTCISMPLPSSGAANAPEAHVSQLGGTQAGQQHVGRLAAGRRSGGDRHPEHDRWCVGGLGSRQSNGQWEHSFFTTRCRRHVQSRS